MKKSIPPRMIPLTGHQVSFQLEGKEKTRWHFGTDMPRPFFFPLMGPSGDSITRMGHPGAPNHDHHQSVWFAHHNVSGVSFWNNQSKAIIRQKDWMCYQDAEDLKSEAMMAVILGWYDGHDPRELLQQELIVAFGAESNFQHSPTLDQRSADKDKSDAKSEMTSAESWYLELQTTLKPTSAELSLGKTNFGLLAVRVAAHISEYFGGGRLTNSELETSEKNIFGKQSRWMDYSGAALNGIQEGITFFDHPKNPGYPSWWHVREDGWMGASLCMKEDRILKRNAPLSLRYLLLVHAGTCQSDKLDRIAAEFSNRPALQVLPDSRKHRQYKIERKGK